MIRKFFIFWTKSHWNQKSLFLATPPHYLFKTKFVEFILFLLYEFIHVHSNEMYRCIFLLNAKWNCKIRSFPMWATLKGNSFLRPSSIYSCSIGHIWEHEFCHLGCWAVSEKFLKRRNFCLSMLLFGVVFSCFHGQKIIF